MAKNPLVRLFILLLAFAASAQRPELSTALISEDMKLNANAVVRSHTIDIEIGSRKSIVVKENRTITVLNERGLYNINAAENRPVKSISATVYDAFGKEIKKLKRKDFREVALSEGSIITDNKTVYLQYTPIQYPFTIVYESETSDSNTAFIERWMPQDEPLVSVEKSVVNVSFANDLGFKYKTYNFDKATIAKSENPGGLTFSVEKLPAVKSEQYTPSLQKFLPYVLFGLEKFHLEGVDGDATSWANFGLWQYNNLLAGTDELPTETQARIKSLVGDEKDPLEIAKIVYKYVQDKTRYVSIQLGIGGWKPMLAKDVDRLGYGDCKALSNYTRALLQVVGVPSYYTLITAGTAKQDLRDDFVSMQGNHAILAVPNGDKLCWLECTSQTAPFNFQAGFTDDRIALVVKPEGGQLVKTNSYNGEKSAQISNGMYTLTETGGIKGEVKIVSSGIQYANREDLERRSADDRNRFYKEYFSQLRDLKLSKADIQNDRGTAMMTENINLSASGYGDVVNGKIIFPVNSFNQLSSVPQRYRTRTNPFEISTAYHDFDEIIIKLPEGYAIEATPENIEINDVYGHYKTEYIVVDAAQILYKRSLSMNEGVYPAADYEKFRKFREQIARHDNAKCVLTKI